MKTYIKLALATVSVSLTHGRHVEKIKLHKILFGVLQLDSLENSSNPAHELQITSFNIRFHTTLGVCL